MEKLTHFESEKRGYIYHFLADIEFKGTDVNKALPSLHKGSLEMTLTVP